MEGPEIFWGSDGVLEGYDESDIKGYDNFDVLAGAIEGAGIDLSGGEYRAAWRGEARASREVLVPRRAARSLSARPSLSRIGAAEPGFLLSLRYTLLAPSNSAIEKHNTEVGTPIDAAVLK
jgi:hypothetical protein